MTRNVYRVFSKNDADLELAKKKFLPLAMEGKKLWEFVDDPKVAESSPEIIEYQFLLYAALPQYFRSSVLIKLEKLEKDFTEEWNTVEKELKEKSPEKLAHFKEKKLLDLKTRVASIFSEIKDSSELLREADGHSERIRKNNITVTTFFDLLKKRVEEYLKEERLKTTHLEFNRGLCIDDEPISPEGYSYDRETELKKFKEKLGNKKANKTLIDFSVEYLNQLYLIAGASFLEGRLKDELHKEGIEPIDSKKCEQKINITMESRDSMLVTCRIKNRFKSSNIESLNSSILNETQTESFLQFRITLTQDADEKPKTPFSNVKVEVVDATLNIYEPLLRAVFIHHRNIVAIEKIKENYERRVRGQSEIHLTANDKLAIELYTQNIKTENGDVDKSKINDARSLFALLWNDVNDAENLLLNHDFSPDAFLDGRREGFFARKPSVIIKDLTIIKNKHHFSLQVVGEVDHFIKLLEFIEKRDIKSIKSELRNSKSKMLMCLHSINEIKFVKELLKHSVIKNNLDESLLAHFATLDASIAKSLLKPSLWERIKFAVRSRFHYTVQDEKLPRDRFTSAGLKRIIETFPHFWTSLFRKPKKSLFQSKDSFLEAIRKNDKYKDYYRYKLSGDDLKGLIDLNNGRTRAWYKAADEITNDTILFERAGRGQSVPENQEGINQELKLPASVQAVYLEENDLMTLERLATDKKEGEEGKKWLELQDELDGDQLKRFYKTKFNLDYKIDPACLLNSIVDMWADTDQAARHTTWASKLYELANNDPEKKYIELVREALIEVVEDKTFDVASSKLRAKYKVPRKISIAEAFLIDPFENTYKKEFFSKSGMHHLQSTLLSNTVIFKKMFDEPAFNKVEDLTDFLLNHLDNFILLFDNPQFKELATSLPLLFESLKNAFEDPAVKKLAGSDYRLNTLIAELTKNTPSYKQKVKSYNLIINLYNDENFMAGIQHIPGMLEYFEQLLASAHFKLKLREDLFLFKTTWEIAKKVPELATDSQPNEKLLELSVLLPSEKFKSWLEVNSSESKFLIEKLIKDPAFYSEFKKQPSNIIELLLRKAKPKQLHLLLLNCDEFGKHYLSTLKNIHQSKEDSSDKLSLQEFIQSLSVFDVGMMIVKYPGSIKNPEYPGILKTIVAAGLLDATLQEKIAEALKQVYSLIDQTELQTIKNINPVFKNTIDQLEKATSTINAEATQDELVSLYKAKENHPEEIGTFLLNQLRKEEVRLKTIQAVLSDPELIVPYLNGAVKYKEIPTQLGDIANLIKSKLGEESLKKFTNLVLEKAIADTGFMIAIQSNTELNKYFNQVADIHLLAQFILTKKHTLVGWLEGLTRISKDKGGDLFLMSTPAIEKGQEEYRQSNKKSLYLYKDKDGFFYIAYDGEKYFLKDDVKDILKKAEFNQPANNPKKCEIKEIRDTVLKLTSEKNHTDKTLFDKYSKKLSSLKDYGRWLFKKEAVNEKGIRYIDSLTEKEIIDYILKGEFDASNLADWLLEGYQKNQRIFKDASNDNIEYHNALNLFLREASKIPNKLCQLAVVDLQVNKYPSPFVNLMLGEPFLSHLLTTADSKSIEILLLELKTQLSTQNKEFNEVINRYFTLAFERKEIGAKLFESETVVKESIDYVDVKDHDTAIKILLLAGEHKKFASSVNINNWMEKKSEEILQFFLENENGNALIKFYLNLLLQNSTEPTNGSLAMVNAIEKSEKAFRLMFKENLNPKLQQKLLINIFKNKSPEIKSHMRNIGLHTKLDHLRRILQGLSGNELVDLYLADGIDLGKNNSPRKSIIVQPNNKPLGDTYYFRDFFTQNWVRDRMFLFADDNKLFQLFEKSDELAKSFADKALEKRCDLFLMSNPATEEGQKRYKQSDRSSLYLYEDKDNDCFFYIAYDGKQYSLKGDIILQKAEFDQPDNNPKKCEVQEIRDSVLKITSERGHTLEKNELSVALTRRLAECKLPHDENFAHLFIRKFSQDFEGTISKLMNSSRDVYSNFGLTIRKKPQLIIRQDKLDSNYIDLMIKNGSTEELVNLLNSFGNEENKIAKYIHNLLTAKNADRNQDLTNKLLSYFGTVEKPENDLIYALITKLSTKEVSQILLSTPVLDKIFLKYFESYPQNFEVLFKENFQVLERYFALSDQKSAIYLLLHEKLSNSKLIDLIIDQLASRELSVPLIKDASPDQIAQIYNLEALSEKASKPVTECIFPDNFRDKEFTQKLLEALPLVNDKLVFSEHIRKAMEYTRKENGEIAGDISIANKFMENFVVSPGQPCLRFKTFNTKPLSLNHRIAYLYAIRQKSVFDIMNLPKDKLLLSYAKTHEYIGSVQAIAEHDLQGRFFFKDTKDEVPLEHAIPYYIATSRFFHADLKITKNDKHPRASIEEKPALRNALVSTLNFDNNGVASFSLGFDKSMKVPTCYTHMVLYAYSQIPDITNKLTPSLANAVLKSVTLTEGTYIFTGSPRAKSEQKPKPIPPKYLELVEASIRYLSNSKEEIKDSGTLTSIVSSSNGDELLNNNINFLLSLIRSIYLDINSFTIRLSENNKIAPEEYVTKILKTALQQLDKIPQSDVPNLLILLSMFPELNNVHQNQKLCEKIVDSVKAYSDNVCRFVPASPEHKPIEVPLFYYTTLHKALLINNKNKFPLDNFHQKFTEAKKLNQRNSKPSIKGNTLVPNSGHQEKSDNRVSTFGTGTYPSEVAKFGSFFKEGQSRQNSPRKVNNMFGSAIPEEGSDRSITVNN